ncbi:Nacht ankyrin domain-containing protein [Fusarium globosum]|uniref:Nacht ankyrin domain-containing protein n=1 Tax=Fusarium globosum TaxID=78864 RepID=A0A8H5XM67_9HYPO|nr:Nacht ankyrin domain-containing protein [Fusarium globosum]
MAVQSSIKALKPFSPAILAPRDDEQVHASILVFTSLITVLFFVIKHHRKPPSISQNKRPITAHGCLPFIGHALAVITCPESFLRQLLCKLCSTPIQVLLPTGRFYLGSPGDQATWLLKSGRQTVPTPSLLYAFQIFFGLKREDLKVFEHSNISIAEARLGFSTSHQDPSRRIMEHQRRDFRLYLRGPGLNPIIHRFLGILKDEMFQRTAIANDWVEVPDLYTFVVTKVFRSEVEALYGRHIFATCPNLEEDFWRFYDAFPRISLGLPRWLSASCYRTRDKMLENLRRWRISCQNTRRLNDPDLRNAEYDSIWGCRYTQRMLSRFFALGFTEDGVDTAMLGFFFATFANTIPAAAWMMLHLHLNDGMVDRVRAELSKTALDKSGFVRLDDLAQQPLLNSIYYETLRLRVAGTVGRQSPIKIQAPGGWEFGANFPMLIPSWLSGLDSSFWNTGGTLPDGKSQHPVDKFWGERFLQYPDDPLSGPVRKEHSSHQNPAAKAPQRSESDDCSAQLVTKGTQGHWFPFGGGTSKCPGEALAGQTILTAVVFMLCNFDIQLCAPKEAGEIRSQHRALPFGSHAFDRPVPIRIRRRKHLRY